MLKKLKYYFQIFPLVKHASNWYVVVFLYLFPGHEVILKLRNGVHFKIRHHLDALTVKEIFLGDEYAGKPHKPKVVIDVGANIGTFSILESINYRKAKIYAYEPARETFEMLRFNLQVNKASNVMAFNLGVGGKSGKRKFYTHSASGLSSLFEKREGSIKEVVRVTTLDEVFRSNKVRKCDLLKIDAEGAEYEILLKTPARLFKKVSNIVLEYHELDAKHNSRVLIKFLDSIGFKTRRKKHPLEKDIGIIYASR